jgi:site-specific recombinase XerD
VDPLSTTRPYVELYVRWMQEHRRLAASTVSRRLSVVAGFYRTCVIDGVLEHSPAEYVRRPSVPPQSPTLGLSHRQFEAMLAVARDSANLNDFALVCLLGLLGLRVHEATNLVISDLGEEHGHRVVRVFGKGHKIVLVPMPPAVSRAIDRAVGERTVGPILRNRNGDPMGRHAATRSLQRLQAAAGVHIARMHPHRLRHTYVTTMLDAGVDLRDTQIAARHADPRTTMRYDRARNNLDRHPNYILAAYMSAGTWRPMSVTFYATPGEPGHAMIANEEEADGDACRFRCRARGVRLAPVRLLRWTRVAGWLNDDSSRTTRRVGTREGRGQGPRDESSDLARCVPHL